MTLFEEKYLDKLAFILLNALLFTGETQYVLNKMNQNEKVKLVQHLPDVKMPETRKQQLKQVIVQSLKQGQEVPKAVPIAPTKAVPNDKLRQALIDRLKKEEGVRAKMYKDHYGNPTIGIGHLITPEELPYYRNRTLSQKEIMDLLNKDIDWKLSLIKKDFPKYDSYPFDLKMMIANGYFRGDLAGSPRTKMLIKQGKFKQAADEYLDNVEYRREAKAKSGVYKRMLHNANILKSMSGQKI
jgi:hypothetical protein